MIQIVDEDKSMAKQVTCNNCGAVLEYMPCDKVKCTTTDYTGCTDVFYAVNCPRCSEKVKVNPYHG